MIADTPAVDFVAKLAEDADLILNQPDQMCILGLPDCALDNDLSNQCVEETVRAYYESLDCAGFTVVEKDRCILAVSNDSPKAMEPVLIDMTCFNEKSSSAKTLHLGACYGEEIGFDPDRPSTGMRISAWMDLGIQYPYSRQRKEILIYPNQENVRLEMFAKKEGKVFKDACGKEQNLSPTDLLLELNKNKESIY